MTTAPNKSPLDVARDFCGKNPAALPHGRYKVVDRVDRREPSPDNLTDSGTDKLLARAAAVKDTAEISQPGKLGAALFEKFAKGMDRTVTTLLTYPEDFRRMRIKVELIEAYGAGGRDAHAVRDALDRKYETRPTTTTPTDLGDGLGLEVPERWDEATGPMVAVPVCATCGRTTLGADECRDCKHDRCNDDDAQGAAQERADAAEHNND